ncbi:MAG TPA: type II toxin-antitoxin system VapC family toxin [Ignavibacteriaceae bacterium]|nr:type II toxin-antitoxin system VapC family toxin [Ignavibacteriaceae bacterium]
MNLLQIPKQQSVIIDTNIFVYAAQRSSLQCIKLLDKCANEELFGIIPTHILAELTHVLMLAEARDLGLIKGSNPAKQLTENPNKIKALNRYESLIRDLLSIGLKLESLQREDFLTAISLQRQYGLLTNDALFLAVATRLRVTAMVSADSIFKNVQGIFLYSPDDINE